MGCRSCGVARSIIAGFHPVDPGSNPGTSTKRCTASLFCKINWIMRIIVVRCNPANLSVSSQYEKSSPIVLSPPVIRGSYVKNHYTIEP